MLAVIAQVTPEELAEARRWCELGDRVHPAQRVDGEPHADAAKAWENWKKNWEKANEAIKRCIAI